MSADRKQQWAARLARRHARNKGPAPKVRASPFVWANARKSLKSCAGNFAFTSTTSGVSDTVETGVKTLSQT